MPTIDECDVVVIGAGVLGCSVAHELARRGLRTIDVDRHGQAGAGSTSSSSAVVRFSYGTADAVRMAWEGGQYWHHWQDHVGTHDELGLAPFRGCGQLVFLSDDSAFGDDVGRLWREVGIPHQHWDSAELQRRLPFLDQGLYGPPSRPDRDDFWRDAHGSFRGALFAPDAGYVSDPQLAAHNLQRAAEAHGAAFHFHAEVTSIDTVDGAVRGVTLRDGRSISARAVVNVAGPHSSKVNKLAGVADRMAIRTRALRQEVHHVPAPTGFDVASAGLLAADDDLGFYVRPDGADHVLIGGIEPACDPLVYVDPDQFDTAIDPDQWEVQVLRANRRMPGLGVPHRRRGVVDCYDLSDDWQPVLDRTDLDGFFVAIGSSGNQFKNAGLIGHLMADLIVAVQAGRDHDAHPVHVTGRYTGCTIDLGRFSRNRTVHTSSTMSVLG